jgi:alkanesulfonate monooxygenase SsuD/methylene tetrahydromethanopterin reductase-like flavin-dependent oxidoreductase (luciferase family)
MTHLEIAFNMRAPDWGASAVELYDAALEMAAWADRLGFDRVMLAEHHNTSDGYLPSPIVLAGALGARTNRIEIHLSVVLATLMHPIHLAEDLAVADLLSRGRLHVTLGAGYRKEEFLIFQVNWKKRPSLMVETVATLRQAWTGDAFEFRGHPVRVLPRPVRPGGPPLTLAGTSHGSAKRAATLELRYDPLGEQFYQTYLAELAALGKPLPSPRPGEGVDPLPRYTAVAHDPGAYWATVGPHVLHNANEYAGYAQRKDLTPFAAATDPDELLDTGAARVFTPQELIDACVQRGPDSVVRFNPLEGGTPPEVAWQSLELFEREVLPHLP